MTSNSELAKGILTANANLQPCGIFGAVESCGAFPPKDFLNEFLVVGHDPCDQDGMMKWSPFTLTDDEFKLVEAWWRDRFPGSITDSLGATNWSDWSVEAIERLMP